MKLTAVPCRKEIISGTGEETVSREPSKESYITMENKVLTQFDATQAHHAEWETYVMWAVDSFKLSSRTQPIDGALESKQLAKLLSTLSAGSSQPELTLLESFEEYEYPNEVGPCVYDIHGSCLSDQEWIAEKLAHLL